MLAQLAQLAVAAHEVWACGRRPGQLGGALDDVTDEPQAAPAQGPDVPLGRSRVADRPPCRLHATAKRRVDDVAVAPDGVEQLVARDHAFAMANEMREQAEHLRLDAQRLAATPELVGVRVQLEVTEGVDHGHARRPDHILPAPPDRDRPPRWSVTAE